MTAYLTDLPRIYRQAADHIQANGLHKDDFGPSPFSYSSPTCMAGAINWATTGHPDQYNKLTEAAWEFASHRLPGEAPSDEETTLPDYLEHIAAWNDAAGRTASDVVVRLRALAVEAAHLVAADATWQAEAALLCERITEHSDHLPCDWCPADRDAYRVAREALHHGVAA